MTRQRRRRREGGKRRRRLRGGAAEAHIEEADTTAALDMRMGDGGRGWISGE